MTWHGVEGDPLVLVLKIRTVTVWHGTWCGLGAVFIKRRVYKKEWSRAGWRCAMLRGTAARVGRQLPIAIHSSRLLLFALGRPLCRSAVLCAWKAKRLEVRLPKLALLARRCCRVQVLFPHLRPDAIGRRLRLPTLFPDRRAGVGVRGTRAVQLSYPEGGSVRSGRVGERVVLSAERARTGVAMSICDKQGRATRLQVAGLMRLLIYG